MQTNQPAPKQQSSINSFETIVGAPPVPTSAAVSVMEDGLISVSAKEEKHELILQVQDGEYACKSTFIVGGMVLETGIKVEVEPADDGGGKVIKVKASYKQLLPVPSAEKAQAQAQDEVASTHEMGAAANFKVKLD